jgi:hypothetical protein
MKILMAVTDEHSVNIHREQARIAGQAKVAVHHGSIDQD